MFLDFLTVLSWVCLPLACFNLWVVAFDLDDLVPGAGLTEANVAAEAAQVQKLERMLHALRGGEHGF